MHCILSGACRHLIYINTRRAPARKIFCMVKVSINGFGITRLVAILIVLLFAPLTASATGSAAHTSGHAEHGAGGGHCVDHCLDTGKYPGSPAKAPLHCHLQSPQPQTSGLSRAPVAGDLPLPVLHATSAPARETTTCLPVISARAPIPASSCSATSAASSSPAQRAGLILARHTTAPGFPPGLTYLHLLEEKP